MHCTPAKDMGCVQEPFSTETLQLSRTIKYIIQNRGAQAQDTNRQSDTGSRGKDTAESRGVSKYIQEKGKLQKNLRQCVTS